MDLWTPASILTTRNLQIELNDYIESIIKTVTCSTLFRVIVLSHIQKPVKIHENLKSKS